MKMFRSATLSVVLFLCFLSNANSQTSGFTIPTTHPRLWWNADRLAQAKTWYNTHKFTPRADDPFANAFRYVLTGETKYARTAIDYLVKLELPADEVKPDAIGCDQCRFEGEDAAIVYDWCYDQMTASERTTVITRWNKYLSDVNQQEWGGIGMEANNYYWGVVRNDLEWGIATFHENDQAQGLLDYAINTRWTNSFYPYTLAGGKGGALGEGPQYGSTMMSYPIIPFTSVDVLYGRPMFKESNFFLEAVFNNIYATTPAPIINPNSDNGSPSYYGFFPYNETDIDDLLHEREYFGDYMQVMSNYWKDKPVGQYAKTWMNLTKSNTSTFTDAVTQTVTAKPFTDLPLDYYAPGLGILYSRSKWDVNSSAIQVQMKYVDNVGHAHTDQGNFQLFRKGQWLVKETSGYSTTITGVNGDKDTQVSEADAHNTIFVGVPGKMASVVGFWQTAPPNVTRLESNNNYAYASVDFTDSYQSKEKPEIYENPYVDKIVREFIYVKPIETLVVFDRILSKSKKVPANTVSKTALIHFPVNPVMENANHVTATMGNQMVRLSTLVPSNPNYLVVNEGGEDGLFRLQITTTGQEQSYFVNVLNGYDVGGQKLDASVIETASEFDVTLAHPTLGTAVLKLQKGATSTGGSLAYATTGTPSTFQSFLTTVQNIYVTENGPTWGDRPAVTTGLEDEEVDGISLNVYPNPAQSTLNISATLSKDFAATSSINFVIYNLQGQKIESLSGERSASWNTKDVPNGIYFVVMHVGSKTITQRVAVKH